MPLKPHRYKVRRPNFLIKNHAPNVPTTETTQRRRIYIGEGMDVVALTGDGLGAKGHLEGVTIGKARLESPVSLRLIGECRRNVLSRRSKSSWLQNTDHR